MPPASAFGSVFTRPSPTSRGLGRCVSFRMGRGREQTAAGPRAGACRLRGVGRRCLAPVGKGRCRYAGSTLFALRAKALQSGALDHGVSRERAGFSERFAHQGNLPARRGTGERAAPRRGRRYTPSRRQNAPFSRQNLPHHPTAANAALYKARLMPVAENLPGTRPRPAFRACLRPIRACLRPIPCHLRPSHTFCGLLMSLAAVPCLLLPIRAFMASAPFVAHPAPFTTFPHLLWPLRAFYCLSVPVSVLFAPLTAIPRLFTAYPCLFTAFLRLFTAYPCLLWLSHACLRPFCTFYGPSAPAKVSFPPFPLPPHLPDLSAGRTAGSARTRSRGQPLENPFLENGLHLSRLHVSQNAAGGKPLLAGLPPSIPAFAPFGTKRRTPAPCSWGGRSSTSSQRHWPSALPTTRGSWLRRRNQPCGRLRGWRNADLLRTRWA